MRGFGGSRNGGRANHKRAALAVNPGTVGGTIKGNVMASGGPPGTARGAMSIKPSFTGTGD